MHVCVCMYICMYGGRVPQAVDTPAKKVNVG